MMLESMSSSSAVFALPLLISFACANPSTFCNPLNLDYRFSFEWKHPHREAADPTMVLHNGTYWLFASKSGGYWHSTDMNDWTFVIPTGLPLENYAPMVVVMGDGKFYYTAGGARAIYSTSDPYVGIWSKVSDMKTYADPGILVDSDGKVYMYYGCEKNGNISAVQLDNTTWDEIGSPVDAIVPDFQKRGFEVMGDNNEHTNGSGPFNGGPSTEGAYMNKIGRRYYLQYAVPGTNFKSYSDGLFVGDAPLGPFQLQDYSPFSHKPTGFSAGAGHSSTYLDNFGNYWHIGTSVISVRALFERRLGIYPVVHDVGTGMLFADTYLGDYPQPLPHAIRTDAERGVRVPQWMLLSLNKSASASSGKNVGHAFDEDIRTWWTADSNSTNEWLEVDLGGAFRVNAVQINFADEGCTVIGSRPAANDTYRYFVEYCASSTAVATSAHDCDWKPVAALDRKTNTKDMPHDYVELPSPLSGVTHMRINNLHMPGGSKFSIAGFRIFGLGPEGGSPPAAVATETVKVKRDINDGRHVTVTWPQADGAEFYIVRYGVSANDMRLMHNYQVYGSTSLDIHALVAGVEYAFTVDAVNSNGVTLGRESTMFI